MALQQAALDLARAQRDAAEAVRAAAVLRQELTALATQQTQVGVRRGTAAQQARMYRSVYARHIGADCTGDTTDTGGYDSSVWHGFLYTQRGRIARFSVSQGCITSLYMRTVSSVDHKRMCDCAGWWVGGCVKVCLCVCVCV